MQRIAPGVSEILSPQHELGALLDLATLSLPARVWALAKTSFGPLGSP